jgi:hypothetical protein
MDAVMLTIEDLKSKLAWETPDDILDLLEIDIITVLDELDDFIIDAQDKLRDYYDEDSTDMGREEEPNQS